MLRRDDAASFLILAYMKFTMMTTLSDYLNYDNHKNDNYNLDKIEVLR